jgi:hypothetical protein
MGQSEAAGQVHHRHRLGRVDDAWNEFDDVAIEITPGPRWRSWCGDLFTEQTTEAMGGSTKDVWRPDDG